MIGDFMLGEGMVGGDAIEADYVATSAGVAATAGTLSAATYLTVASTGTATGSSTLSPQRAFTANAASQASVAGAVTPKRGVTATAAGHATTSSTVRATRTCQAASAGVSLVTVIMGAGAVSLTAHPTAQASTISTLTVTHAGVTRTLAAVVHGQAVIHAVLDVTVTAPVTVPAPFHIHYGLGSGGPRRHGQPLGHYPVKRGRFA